MQPRLVIGTDNLTELELDRMLAFVDRKYGHSDDDCGQDRYDKYCVHLCAHDIIPS